jgi:hypothetical protein
LPRSPRDIATRLGIDQNPVAQRAYRLAESARYFRRGLRFAERFSSGRAHPPAEVPTSDLERYAEAHTEGPGIFKWLHYFDIYDRHLSRFRGQPVTLVEIGVAGGGSVGMWRDYLGPQAQIIGVDVDSECRRFAGENVEIVIGDQGNLAFWSSFLDEHGAIDIVIDDGGHLPEQQVVTLESLLAAIRPDGVYICEDIHGPMQPFHAYVDGLTRPLSSVGFANQDNPASGLQRQIASVHRYPLMTVIEKLGAAPDHFECRRYGTEWPEDWTTP